MGLHAVKILGIKITTDSKKDILEYIRKYFTSEIRNPKSEIRKENKPLVIVTPNPEQIVLAHKDETFREILNQADVSIPDGGGVVWAYAMLHAKCQMINDKKTIQRIPGVEFMQDLAAMAAKRGIRVGLIGGWGNVAVGALECLSRRTPGLKGWGMSPPLVKLDQLDELDKLAKFVSNKIQKTGVGMVFVGLGAPKQEYFIARLARECQMSNVKCKIVLMSVGGSFDIIANRTPRAPEWLMRFKVPLFSGLIGSEFIWRLLREPWRWRRQLALAKFVTLVAKNRYTKI